MAITNYSIDTYTVYHYTNDNTYDQTAVVNCYQGATHRASLYFYQDGAVIPASSKIASGALYLRFPGNQFSDVMATLREEKPLSVGFNDSNLWGWLTSSTEPVGEEEGV